MHLEIPEPREPRLHNAQTSVTATEFQRLKVLAEERGVPVATVLYALIQQLLRQIDADQQP